MGLIAASFVVAIVHTAVSSAFSFLFPGLSAVLDGVVLRLVPVLLFAVGLLLLGVLSLVLAAPLLSRKPMRNASVGSRPMGRRFAMAVVVLGVCVGLSFSASYAAYGNWYHTESADPP